MSDCTTTLLAPGAARTPRSPRTRTKTCPCSAFSRARPGAAVPPTRTSASSRNLLHTFSFLLYPCFNRFAQPSCQAFTGCGAWNAACAQLARFPEARHRKCTKALTNFSCGVLRVRSSCTTVKKLSRGRGKVLRRSRQCLLQLDLLR